MSKMQVFKRREAANARRRARYDAAEDPAAQLNAAFDYLRSALKALPESKANEHRTVVAGQLIQISDDVRKKNQGDPTA